MEGSDQGIAVGLQFTTIISVSAVIACTQGGFLFGLWLMDRRVAVLAWWAAAFGALALGCAMVAGRSFGAPWPVSLGGGGLMILAFGLLWQATRVFEGRAVTWAPVAGAPLLWLLAGLLASDGFDLQWRASSAALLFSGFLVLALWEVWRGRREALSSRGPLAIALVTAIACIVGQLVLGEPVGRRGGGDVSLAIGVWLTLAAAIALSTAAALALGMTRERQQRVRAVFAALDPQTGALNLGAFLGPAARLVARQLKTRAPVTFVAVQFRRAGNGHLADGVMAGDAAIVEERIRSIHDNLVTVSRVTGIVARLRPSGFAVIMPDVEPEEAAALIQRALREGVSSTNLNWSGVSDAGNGAVAQSEPRAWVTLAGSSEVGHDLRALMLAAEAAMDEAQQGPSGVFAIYNAPRSSWQTADGWAGGAAMQPTGSLQTNV